ncbi:MAG: IS4 family transposase [Fischerella sp. CENA71]|nr:IS4 family transposase [Fischerella sp. CENA71]
MGDKRRNQRLIKIVEDLSAQPNESVTQASRDAAAVQGVYEFWANPRIKAEAIISSHAISTVERIKDHETILAIQDTTELDFSDHKSKRGMGPLSNPEAKGLKVHTVLAASTEGVPLGVLHQKVWSREKTRSNASKQKRQAIENKESIRWLEGLDLTQGLMPGLTTVITVADREADIYQLFALARQRNSEFLIRAAQNRNTKSNAFCDEVVPLFEAIRTTPILGKLTLDLQRTPRRAARSATLSVRVTKLWLQPPASLQSQSTQAIEVHVIEACEENPPEGEKPISWLLLTTMEVKDFESACHASSPFQNRAALHSALLGTVRPPRVNSTAC